MLNHNPVLGTLHPPRRVTETDRYPPQWHKIPATLRQTIIAWSRKTALRAESPDSTVRRHCNLNQRRISAKNAHPHVLVDKSNKPLHPIQDGLNLYLNSWSPLCSFAQLPRKQQTKRSDWRSAISSSRKNQNRDSSQRRWEKRKSRHPCRISKHHQHRIDRFPHALKNSSKMLPRSGRHVLL